MEINRHCCKHCKKQFTTRQAKFKHEKICQEMKRTNSGNNLKTTFTVDVEVAEKKSVDIDRFSFYFLFACIFIKLNVFCCNRWVKDIFSNCCRVVLNKGNDRLNSDGIVNVLEAADKEEKYISALKTFLQIEVYLYCCLNLLVCF